MKQVSRRISWLIIAAAGIPLGACTTKYSVGGTVTGLSGSGLVLQNNSGDNFSVSASGAFVFSTDVANGDTYAVTVATQPTNPAQTCIVHNGSGTIDKADITHVIVTCTEPGNYAYVADQTSNDIGAFSIDSSSGVLTPVAGSPFDAAGTAPASVVVDPNRRYLYVANNGSNTVAVFSIDAATGTLTAVGTPAATGSGPVAIYVEPSGQYLYVANQGDNDISAYAINQSTGQLTPLSNSPFAAGSGVDALQTDPGGNFLYAANYGADNISAFSIDAATGALAGIAGSPFGTGRGPASVSIDPAGTYAYVADETADSISAYAINPGTGALTPVSGSPFATGSSSPASIAVDPAGSHVYVANATSANQVAAFTIVPASGALTLDETIGAGEMPMFVSVDPSGNFIYVANNTSNGLSVYDTASGAGVLTAVNGAPFTTGAGPRSIAID